MEECGILESWNLGILESWNLGIFKFEDSKISNTTTPSSKPSGY